MHFCIMRRAVWSPLRFEPWGWFGSGRFAKGSIFVGYSRQPTVKVFVNQAVVYYICNKRDRIK